MKDGARHAGLTGGGLDFTFYNSSVKKLPFTCGTPVSDLFEDKVIPHIKMTKFKDYNKIQVK